jgi:hypothetical protein
VIKRLAISNLPAICLAISSVTCRENEEKSQRNTSHASGGISARKMLKAVAI